MAESACMKLVKHDHFSKDGLRQGFSTGGPQRSYKWAARSLKINFNIKL